MKVRDDRMALTRPALVALANAGFVKRAERELEQGQRPAISEDEGAIVVVFPDATTRLVAGKTLAQAPCTCGANPMCRHRVAAVLAYQALAAEGADASNGLQTDALPESSNATHATKATTWSPGEVDDGALERLLGPSALARARALVKRGLVAEVVRGGSNSDDVPYVHLPTSTVRFLVPRDVTHARCDCTLRTGCEHVALAVWAFREADLGRDHAATQVVELGATSQRGTHLFALDTALAVATAVLMEGVADLGSSAATRFALARHGLERAGLAWPLAALEELEDLSHAYRKRSARYEPMHVAAVLAELFARARAGRGSGGEVPVRTVLGADEALETRLDQTRLQGLGVHLEDDGDTRIAHIYLADVRSASILVLQRRFSGKDDGPTLALRTALAGSSLAAVAAGQIVSNAAVRRANRAVSFATGILAKTSVMPGGDLEALASSLFITDVAALVARLRAAPPHMLMARLATSDLFAIRVHEVVEVGYDDARQTLVALARDVLGATFSIELDQRALAPGAIAALAAAMLPTKAGEAMEAPELRTVVGRVRLATHGLVVTPLAMHCSDARSGATRVVALELLTQDAKHDAALAALPHVRRATFESQLSEAIAEATRVVNAAAHHGLRQAPAGFRVALGTTRVRLAELGLVRAAAAIATLEQAHATAQVSGSDPDERAAAEAWASAAIRLALLTERA